MKNYLLFTISLSIYNFPSLFNEKKIKLINVIIDPLYQFFTCHLYKHTN